MPREGGGKRRYTDPLKGGGDVETREHAKRIRRKRGKKKQVRHRSKRGGTGCLVVSEGLGAYLR